MSSSPIVIRRATASDVETIYRFICSLASFEKAADQVKTSPQQILDTMFGDSPACWAELVEDENGVQGMALWYPTYSTWEGVRGIHMEELWVEPAARGKGYAALLIQRLARIITENGWARLEWSVLTWNDHAITVYDHLGGRPLDEWYQYRMVGEPLDELAARPLPETVVTR